MNGKGRGKLWLFLPLISLSLLGCNTEGQPSNSSFAGRGHLLASGDALGDTWNIYCGVSPESDTGIGFSPARRNACATGGHPYPCVHAEFQGSSMVRCQLEELPRKIVIAGAFPVGNDERLWFGAVDPRVVRVKVEMGTGEDLQVSLASPTDAAFKVFAVGLTRDQARSLKRCVFLDSAGREVMQLKEEDVIEPS